MVKVDIDVETLSFLDDTRLEMCWSLRPVKNSNICLGSVAEHAKFDNAVGRVLVQIL